MQLSEAELTAALRFCETCEDGEGFDVPKPMMKQLAGKGLVRYAHFGRYEGTAMLDRLQAESHTGIWDEFQIAPADAETVAAAN